MFLQCGVRGYNHSRMTTEVLDADPQLDYLAHLVLDLGRYVKKNSLDGKFAIEFSSHQGDIRSARKQSEIPAPLPPAK